ncbi:MAG: DNA/RNA non-specific endonuclease [Bacteroidetes bacterium]|nr:MAG: DNA/RNA non-specific endonuclease [Bacteroidota bacterium]TAG87532.1 MAG: DNA/RNA non-specific endonuclease [Bacteroidota bacterium]
MKNLVYASLVFILMACDPSIKKDAAVIPQNLNSEHLQLGNPSNATINPLMPDNYLIIRNEYATSYNNSKGHANWTAWNLTSSWLGSVSRGDDFRADPDLPDQFVRVGSGDYSGSGFDRGHLCPSSDRTNTDQANSMTFLMTNMIPQAPANNQGPWNTLESYTRSLLSGGTMECHIFAGAYGTGGWGSTPPPQGMQGQQIPNASITNSLRNGQINVPARTWKIIVLLPIGVNDENRIDANTRVIAVDMPNRYDINTNWRTPSYRKSVRDIENATGLNFMSKVPQAIQDIIETRVDNL